MKRAAWAAAILLVLSGCVGNGKAVDPSAQTLSIPDLALSTVPYTEATLMLKGTPISVTLQKSEGEEGAFTLQMMAEGQLIEDESYVLDEKGLAYAGTSMEQFDPPIPLFSAPFVVPNEWDWRGKMVVSKQSLPASAILTSARETLNIPGGPFEAAKVTVKIRFQSSGPRKAVRTLTFWAADGKGIIRRDFAESSTREPRSVPAPNEEE